MVVFGFLPVWSLAMALGGGVYCFPDPPHEQRSWWPELVVLGSGVSLNKPVQWWVEVALLLFFFLCRWRGVGEQRKEEVVLHLLIHRGFLPVRLVESCSSCDCGSQKLVSCCAPWWRGQYAGGSDGGLFNKLSSFSKYIQLQPSSFVQLLALLAGLGGEGESERVVAGAAVGVCWGIDADQRLQDAPNLHKISVCGYVNLALHHLRLEIIVSGDWSIVCAAQIFVNCRSQISIIVYVHTQESSSHGSTLDQLEQAYFTCHCCASFSLMNGPCVEDTVLSLFGLCHRRWTTTPPSLILRFDSKDSWKLSSVKDIRNLQLNSLKPQAHTPDRPLDESTTGHQLVWSAKEAFEDCICSKFEPVLSTDKRPLFDSICNLRLPPRETQQLAGKAVVGEQVAGRFSLRKHATTSEAVSGEQAEGRLPPREHATAGEDFADEQAGGGSHHESTQQPRTPSSASKQRGGCRHESTQQLGTPLG